MLKNSFRGVWGEAPAKNLWRSFYKLALCKLLFSLKYTHSAGVWGEAPAKNLRNRLKELVFKQLFLGRFEGVPTRNFKARSMKPKWVFLMSIGCSLKPERVLRSQRQVIRSQEVGGPLKQKGGLSEAKGGRLSEAKGVPFKPKGVLRCQRGVL